MDDRLAWFCRKLRGEIIMLYVRWVPEVSPQLSRSEEMMGERGILPPKELLFEYSAGTMARCA